MTAATTGVLRVDLRDAAEGRYNVHVDWEHGDERVDQAIASAILFVAEQRQAHPNQVIEDVLSQVNELEYCGRVS